ncbi:MAG TPA: hypothetical protein VMA09_18280 [Candidatus Binataceae bacterium]|nr:hypothetical protein [Candidatus Binataceae bacterium]
MADEPQHRIGDWSLGGEPPQVIPPTERPPSATPPTQPMPEPLGRLDRQLFAVTVEHVGWALVAVYTILSRLVALGARPLGADEARRALLELASVQAAIPPDTALAVHPSWIEIAQRWIFSICGADDLSARIVVAASGIILVGAAWLMRRYIGRAGALALAAMLAFSPTATYLARGGAGVVPAAAFMLIAIALALSLGRAPSVPLAAVIGLAIAPWLTASPAGPILALTILVALIPVGLWTLIVTDHRGLRFRVWWQRRRSVVLIATIAAIFATYYLATAMLSRPLRDTLSDLLDELQVLGSWSAWPGLHFYLPALGFYEFLIVLLALVGVIVSIVAARSRLAAFAILWALINTAVFLLLPAPQMEYLLAILVPLALLAAIGINALAMSSAWTGVRIAIAALGLLTLYVATLVNFVFSAPNTGQAAWRRHLLLYWVEPSTTIQTRHECMRILSAPQNADASFWAPPYAPQVSWYLNSMRAAPDRPAAQISIASPSFSTSGPREFSLDESWDPDPTKLTLRSAILYFALMRPWTDAITYNDLRVTEQTPAATPSAAPSPSPSAAASPSATPSQTPSAPAETTPTPRATSTPAATPSAAPEASSSASPRPSSTATSANL